MDFLEWRGDSGDAASNHSSSWELVWAGRTGKRSVDACVNLLAFTADSESSNPKLT